MNFYQRVLKKFKKELFRLKKRRLEIILYHFVSNENNIFTSSGHNVKPAIFREQIEYLSKNFTIVPLSQAWEILSGRGDGGPYVSLCFDDGYFNNILEAYPIIEEFQVPATMFICPSVLDNHDLLWRDKIRYIINNNLPDECVDFLKKCNHSGKYNFALLKNMTFYNWSKEKTAIGDMSIQDDLSDFFESKHICASDIAKQYNLYISRSNIKKLKYLDFGNHTWSHPLLSCLDSKQQETEITKAHHYLEEAEVRPLALSLPFAPHNANTREICQKLNYDFILDVNDGANIIKNEKNDFLVLHRKMAPTAFKKFKAMI